MMFMLISVNLIVSKVYMLQWLSSRALTLTQGISDLVTVSLLLAGKSSKENSTQEKSEVYLSTVCHLKVSVVVIYS